MRDAPPGENKASSSSTQCVVARSTCKIRRGWGSYPRQVMVMIAGFNHVCSHVPKSFLDKPKEASWIKPVTDRGDVAYHNASDHTHSYLHLYFDIIVSSKTIKIRLHINHFCHY